MLYLYDFILCSYPEMSFNSNEETPAVPLHKNSQLIESYNLFLDYFKDQNIQVIYYPCCGDDISCSEAFKGKRVIYLDTHSLVTETLESQGFEAYGTSALKFIPDDPVDTLLLINPQISYHSPAQHIRKGGFLLCNDYHNTAYQAFHDPSQFVFCGIIRKAEKGELFFDDKNLQQCFEEVETDEELQHTTRSFKNATYKEVVEVVRKLYGENITHGFVEKYKLILEKAKEKMQEIGMDTKNGIFYRYGDETIILYPLPFKKGGVENIYVFQKSK